MAVLSKQSKIGVPEQIWQKGRLKDITTQQYELTVYKV